MKLKIDFNKIATALLLSAIVSMATVAINQAFDFNNVKVTTEANEKKLEISGKVLCILILRNKLDKAEELCSELMRSK